MLAYLLWVPEVLEALVILGLVVWALRSKYQDWKAFRARLDVYRKSLQPLPIGDGFTYTRHWYGGLRHGYATHGVDVRHVIPSHRKMKRASRYFLKAVEKGKVEMRDFDTWSDLVCFVHFKVATVYVTTLCF